LSAAFGRAFTSQPVSGERIRRVLEKAAAAHLPAAISSPGKIFFGGWR